MSSNSNSGMNLNKSSYKTLIGNNRTTFIVIIVIISLIILYILYTFYVSYTNYTKYSPYLVDQISDGTVSKIIPGIKILQSSDSSYGMEFSYNFWIYIKDTNFGNSGSCNSNSESGTMKHIFHKGSPDYKPATSDSPTDYPLLQMPGVWLYPNTNKLNIRFNTYNNIVETADIGNIPLNMWVNISINLMGSSIDVYVNGQLKKRQKLNGVPKINFGDFYVSQWGGFFGYLCNLRYFNYSIPPFMVDQIFSGGPSKQFASDSGVTDPTAILSPNYWMTSGYPNAIGYPGYNQ